MNSFQTVVLEDFEAVNTLIIDQLHSEVGLVENIGHYIVDSGGKRLRPLIVLLMANAANYTHKHTANHHISLAAIIEFIHTATLLHDDVVDVSSKRRGMPTANAKWGNAPSVLVGDFLYSRAFQIMVNIGNMEVMKILSNTTNIIAEGEVQQLVNAKKPDVSENDYFTVIHKKTAALFEAACETATVIASNTDEEIKRAKKFGYHLGMAFQLVDDALDYQGDAEKLGKNIGDDLAEGKPTLPLIQTLKKADKSEQKTIKNAIKHGELDKLTQILNIVKKYDGLTYTTNLATQHAQHAIQALEIFGDSPYKTALKEIAAFSVERNH